ncbi:hypothetical protein E7T06_09795 [Deinococcus sp. Arct2-2]|uniref:hypothetical protein n=1 Tax=Deinococcus sp. Arct2-2 TaxID=2568653 RepID=UPI0010A54F4E|nr:hypothetical protein [Deinococcus sp. Arct2-2]THF69906.1 hypothetical protein E7T06_09760 [Deinococcus sp. Arct2-2]THF69910.1 hypothetical protein E7T06_09795 [Deinococcus sp. Arct2-2]
MTTKMLIATLAASVALSFSASAATTPSTTGAPAAIAQNQPSAAPLILPRLNSAREQAARFTPPEFCYVGKMKVACTLTGAPSKDPTQTVTARFTPPEFCYVGQVKVACTITNAPSKDPTGTRP